MAQKYFFAGLRQTEEMVRILSKKLTTLIDQNELVSVFLKTVIDSFGLDKAGIILRKGTSHYYESEKLIGFKTKNLSLKSDNFLIRHLKKIKSAEIKEELTLKIKDSCSKEKAKTFDKPYSKQDLELLEALTDRATMALDNAKLYQEVKKSLLERIKLHEIMLAISSLVHVDKILNLIVKNAIKFTDSQKSIILIMDEKKKKIYQAAAEPSNSNLLSPAENIQLYDIARRTAKEKKLLFSKLLVSPSGEELPDGKKEEVQTVLSLPLTGQKDILGILITCCSPLHSYDQEQVQILSILADQAVIAIEKVHLIDDLKRAQVDLENWGKELGRKVKEKTEELKKSQAQLLQSEKLAGIGQLAAGIAHEIRNPLGIIATSLYYLNETLPEKKEDTKRHFQIMEAEINRCESIISNLLEFSRKSTQEFELIDVNQLLNITLPLVEKDLFVKDIKLIKKFRHSPTIKANMDEMKQVFLNLILNATQAMPRGGKLEIATSITENERARIKVADSGTGISEKHLSKIFDPFFTTKAPGEGTGLGLTLTYNIIERWGGTIPVKSQGAEGTTFTIEFPILKEEPSQEEINAPTS
jgi:signal transduction histidine kinase